MMYFFLAIKAGHNSCQLSFNWFLIQGVGIWQFVVSGFPERLQEAAVAFPVLFSISLKKSSASWIKENTVKFFSASAS